MKSKRVPGRSTRPRKRRLWPWLACALLSLTALEGRLVFERNLGQADPGVLFLARQGQIGAFLAQDQVVLRIGSRALKMRFEGALQARLAGEAPQPGKAHYLLGADRRHWKTEVPLFGKVRYEGLYPGIDLVFYERQGRLEFDFVLRPQSHPEQILLRFEGVDELNLGFDGALALATGAGTLRLSAPRSSQEDGQIVPSAFEIADDNSVRFKLGEYDRSQTLRIDPVLSYATYLGGSGDDTAFAVATDSSGAIYLAGGTQSIDFPLATPLQPIKGGGQDPIDGFITKLSPDGQTILYSTFLGGANLDEIRDIAIDPQGSVLLAGVTQSPDFPTNAALQPECRLTPQLGCRDAFIAKLESNGSALAFSTFLGGGSLDLAQAAAIGPEGSLYVAGETFSTDFPVSENAYQGTSGGGRDAFVVKLTQDGQALLYATYVGGSGLDQAADLAIASPGQAVLAGLTTSPDLGTSPDALQANFGGLIDAFAIRLTSDGRDSVFATYLGGVSNDAANALVLDVQGNAYLTGITSSDDFPVSQNAPFAAKSGLSDAFAAKLGADGTQLHYATFLGGGASDEATGAALGADGRLWIAGRTSSTDFPQAHPLQAGFGGVEDAFAALLSADGSRLVHSTFLGGSAADGSLSASSDLDGNLLLTGFTTSIDFPTVNPLQAGFGGGAGLAFGAFAGGDAFLARLIDQRRLSYAQFGDADGFSSQILLRDLDAAASPRLVLLLRDDQGTDLTVGLNGVGSRVGLRLTSPQPGCCPWPARRRIRSTNKEP